MSEKLEKLFKDNYDKNLPEIVRIPPLGDNRTEILKPLEQATLDDIALAVEAYDGAGRDGARDDQTRKIGKHQAIDGAQLGVVELAEAALVGHLVDAVVVRVDEPLPRAQ